MLLLAGVVLILAALVYATDLQRQRIVQQTMDGVITRRGQNTVDEITLLVGEQRYVLARYRDKARHLTDAGRFAEGAARMAVGCRAVEEMAPDFLSALRALRRLSRAVGVIVAVDPIGGHAFQAWELRGLAGFGVFLHYLLLTGRRRMLLRLHIVFTAFRLALRWLHGSVDRAARSPQEWGRIDALVADLGTAGDEAVVAARHIVQALDAVELDPEFARRAGF